eukprot:gene9765-12333_t
MALQPEPPRPPAAPRAVATQPGWRRMARGVAQAAGLAHTRREPLLTHAAADSVLPLQRPPSFSPYLCEPVTKKDGNARRKEVALRTIARMPPAQVTVYTDGSVLCPKRSRHGGGAYVLTDGAGAEHRGRTGAGAYCTSFVAEQRALHHALRSMLDDDTIVVPHGAEIRMLTDSQSAIRALERGPQSQQTVLGQRIWSALCAVERWYNAHITVAYVPGHVQIDEQEEADKEAKEAARDAHWWDVTRGTAPRWPKGLTRGQERVIAQLRAGKCPITASYRHLIDEADCPCDSKRRAAVDKGEKRCQAAECACGAPLETVRHLILECPMYETARQEMLTPKTGRSLDLLAREPGRALAFLRRIRREGCAAEKPKQ